MRLFLSVDLPTGLDLLARLRHTIRDALSLCAVAMQEIDDVELMIGELSTNAARHSFAGEFHVDVNLKGEHVTITVADTGEGFQPDSIGVPGTARLDENGRERMGGWGLPLVESLSDELTFSPNAPHARLSEPSKCFALFSVARRLVPRA